MPTVKLVFDINEDLRNRFKSKLALQGETIKDVLTRMIAEYLREAKTPQQKRGRR